MKFLIIVAGCIVWYLASLLTALVVMAMLSLLGMTELVSDELTRSLITRIIMVLVAIPVGILERIFLRKWADWKEMRDVLKEVEQNRRMAQMQEKQEEETDN